MQRVFRSGGAFVLGLVALVASASAGTIGSLHAHARDVAAREHAALLGLYALDSRLETARSELATIESRASALRTEQRRARTELGVARKTLSISEHQLGDQVRTLYEHEQPGVLEIVLGASSLDELLTGLDSISRAARATSGVVSEARTARARVALLSRSLARRARMLEGLRAEAAAKVDELGSARAARASYVARLRADGRLTADRIVTLEAQASAAQARARTTTIAAQAVPTVASFVAQPAGAGAADASADPVRPASGNRITVLSTGYSLKGSTATGVPVAPGVVAVDPSVIPLGTRLSIPGYGNGVAADTGPAIQGLRIDLWFPTEAAARAWGWRTVTIVLH